MTELAELCHRAVTLAREGRFAAADEALSEAASKCGCLVVPLQGNGEAGRAMVASAARRVKAEKEYRSSGPERTSAAAQGSGPGGATGHQSSRAHSGARSRAGAESAERVTFDTARRGEFVISEVREDGSLVLRPDDGAPNFAAVALVTVDVQEDWVSHNPPLPTPKRICDLIDVFREARRPVVHMVRLIHPDGSNAKPGFHKKGRRFVELGSHGAQLWKGLFPENETLLDDDTLLAGQPQHLGADECVLYRPRWGAFYQSNLESHLRGRGVSTVVLASLSYEYGLMATLFEANDRNFKVVIAGDATQSWPGHPHYRESYLEWMGVATLKVSQIASALRAAMPFGPN